MTSTYSAIVIRWPTAARSGVSITCTECSGKPATFKPCLIASAIALFDSSASEPPRKIMALPDLMAKDAASSVTFGRDS
ncbi:hypothetical protein D9M71_466770 [compost metagenome]